MEAAAAMVTPMLVFGTENGPKLGDGQIRLSPRRYMHMGSTFSISSLPSSLSLLSFSMKDWTAIMVLRILNCKEGEARSRLGYQARSGKWHELGWIIFEVRLKS